MRLDCVLKMQPQLFILWVSQLGKGQSGCLKGKRIFTLTCNFCNSTPVLESWLDSLRYSKLLIRWDKMIWERPMFVKLEGPQ